MKEGKKKNDGEKRNKENTKEKRKVTKDTRLV